MRSDVRSRDTRPRPELAIERAERLDEPTAAAVATLVERAEVHDRHSPIGEHKFLRMREGDPHTFGLLAHEHGVLVGYAHATRFPRQGQVPERLAAELLVDAEHRGRGIGRALLERLTAEARAAGVERFDMWGHHADAGCSVLAESVGMYVSRSLWQLGLRLASVPAHRRREALPEGVRLRTFEPGRDEESLVELIRAAFPDHPENASWTRDDLDQRVEQPWFDPSAILLAEGDDGTLLGVHWMKLEGDVPGGEVYLLGVAPGVQGHGLGRILLLEGLEEMRRRGLALAYLYVDAENEPAMQLYRQVGFRREHLDTCFSLDLRGVRSSDEAA